MNYVQKTVLLLGIVTAAINGSTGLAQAQSCAEPGQLAVQKQRLDQITQGLGIPTMQTGLAFQNFALETILPGNPIPENFQNFYSKRRDEFTNGAHRFVRPDGVLPIGIVNVPVPFPIPIPIPIPNEIYPKSAFYEVKAVSNESLPPSYSDYQILGFLDVLDESAAAIAGEIPGMIFLTTEDSRPLSFDTRLEASYLGIGLFHAIACERLPNPNGILQLGEAVLHNPEIYLFDLTVPQQIGPGDPGQPFL